MGDADADGARLGRGPHFGDATWLEVDHAVFLVWRNGRLGRLGKVSIHGKMDAFLLISDADDCQIEANEPRDV